MSDEPQIGLIGLYDNAAGADRDFDVLTTLAADGVIRAEFDAAVTTKTAGGEIEILREHRGHPLSKHRHSARRGFGADLFESLLAALGGDGGDDEAGKEPAGEGEAGKESAAEAGEESAAEAGEGDGGKGAGHRLWIHPDKHEAFTEMAGASLDVGEAMLGIVCAASASGAFDELLRDAERVVRVEVHLDES